MTGRHVTCLQFHNPAYSTGIHLHEKKYDAGHLETNFRAGHIQKSCFWPMKIIRTGANTKEREQLLAGLDSAVTPASSWVSACAPRHWAHAHLLRKGGKSSGFTAHAQLLAFGWHTCSTMHPLCSWKPLNWTVSISTKESCQKKIQAKLEILSQRGEGGRGSRPIPTF